MSTYLRTDHQGTGPGEFTPDGCSVELYARLPDTGETGIIAEAAPPPATLLELGAGAGRLTRSLVARGYEVTAVDESAAMLARIAGNTDARTVRGAIEDLDLGERFDVVTLTSHLVNTADEELRAAMLRTCARHVADDGCVVVEREADDLHERAVPGTGWEREGLSLTVAESEPVGEDVFRIRLVYGYEDSAWSQTFYSRRLPEPAFARALTGAGLALDRHLLDDGTWIRAVPAGRR